MSLTGDDRILPPDLDPARTNQLFVAPTDDGWAVLGDDWIQRSVDGQWTDAVPIEVVRPDSLNDPEAYVVRHQFVATDDGFAFVELHRLSNGEEGRRIGTAYRFVSTDGVSWALDPLTPPVESVDPLAIGMHTDDGFTVVRRTDRPGGGWSLANDFHFAASSQLTIDEGTASALGPPVRADDGSVAFAEQVFETSLSECVEDLGPDRGTVSALNLWAPGAAAPLVVPFPCTWQAPDRWLGEGAVFIDDDRIHVVSAAGLWVLDTNGVTLELIEWAQPLAQSTVFFPTPDGTRIVRIGSVGQFGANSLAVYDIGAGEWTDLVEWPDLSTTLVRLVDDDALFYVDARARMLRSISLR